MNSVLVCGNEITTFGGLSRLDNESRICTSCEQAESIEDYLGDIIPKKHWFINTGVVWHTELE